MKATEPGCEISIVVETDDLELGKRLAQQNVGITVALRWSLNNEIARHECAALAIGPDGLYCDWYLAYHNATQLAGPWRSFLRVCLEHLPRLFRNEEARSRRRQIRLSSQSEGRNRSARPGWGDRPLSSRPAETEETITE